MVNSEDCAGAGFAPYRPGNARAGHHPDIPFGTRRDGSAYLLTITLRASNCPSGYDLEIEGDQEDDWYGHPLRNHPQARRYGGQMPQCAIAWALLRLAVGPIEDLSMALGLGDLQRARRPELAERNARARCLQSLAPLLHYA